MSVSDQSQRPAFQGKGLPELQVSKGRRYVISHRMGVATGRGGVSYAARPQEFLVHMIGSDGGGSHEPHGSSLQKAGVHARDGADYERVGGGDVASRQAPARKGNGLSMGREGFLPLGYVLV